MKVSIIGATGKVAKQVIQNAFLFNKSPDLDLVLVSTQPDLVSSQILDIQSTTSLLFDEEHVDPKYQVTAEFAETAESDYVFVCAGRFMPDAEKEQYRSVDPSGRLAHTFASLNMMVEISEQIQEHAPNAKVVVITNQSDIMAEIARNILDRDNVFGFGGMLDEARFNQALAITANSALPANQRVKPADIHADIIGYHNNDMVLLEKSIQAPDSVIQLLESDPTLLDDAMAATKAYGRNISKVRNARQPDISTGASIGPGIACWSAIAALSGQRPAVRASFNVAVDQQQAQAYGLTEGSHFSLPVMMTPRGIAKASNLSPCTEAERPLIDNAVANMQSALSTVQSKCVPSGGMR